MAGIYKNTYPGTWYTRTYVAQQCSRYSRVIIYQPRVYPVVKPLEVSPFYQLPGYSRVLPGLLIPVTSTSNTSYSPSIWARVLVSLRWKPGHVNLSSPKSRSPGSISYDILQDALFKTNTLSHASRGVTRSPITRVLASITRLANTRHGYE